MQYFSKQLLQTRKPRKKELLDDYEKDVEAAKNKVITIENISLAQYSQTAEALQYYSRGVILAVVGLFTSAITYPLSVRIVKSIFGFKSFLNAVLPIMANVNAFVLGITQGAINSVLIIEKYTAVQDPVLQNLL